jgi:TRAP-type C4-dicarboxylate transport system permease small subunit
MYSFFFRLARFFARLGGLALVALIILTCLSIAGRSLNGILHADWLQSIAPSLASGLLNLGVGPINGDFELVEAGMAFAIFSFLPLCQLQGAHASVDIFTSSLPMRANRTLRMVVDVVFAAVIVLIAWQLFEGMQSKLRSGQTTLLLQYPVWWGYAASLLSAVVAAIVSVYVAGRRVVETFTGKHVLPAEMEADH